MVDRGQSYLGLRAIKSTLVMHNFSGAICAKRESTFIAAIKSFLDTSFEKSAFDRYWYGDGDYTLSSGQFNNLVSSAVNLRAFDSQTFFKGGVAYLAEKFSFYGSGFAGSIGSGWLISDGNGQKVGFYDRYDFNSKPWGVRSVMDEIKTRMVSPAGDIFRAQSYEITYGIYTELP